MTDFLKHGGRQPTSQLEKAREIEGKVSLWPTVGKGVFVKSKVERALREGSNMGNRRRRKGGLHEVSQSWDAAETWGREMRVREGKAQDAG